MMFWNEERPVDWSRHLPKASEIEASRELVVPSGWTELVENEALATSAERQKDGIARRVDWDAIVGDHVSFPALVDEALRQWRQNPGRSPLRGMDCLLGASDGKPFFSTRLQQSLFLKSLYEARILRGDDLRIVYDGRERVRLEGGIYDTVPTDAGIRKIECVAKALVLWQRASQERVADRQVKLPRKLYRGIRLSTIAIDRGTEPDDVHHVVRDALVTKKRLHKLLTEPLRASQAVGTLSFSEKRPAAEFFANREGIVIEIDPRELEIVSSWSLEESLAGPDPFNGKMEREWIARVPLDYVLRPDQISVRDAHYAMATGDASQIDLVYHDYVGEYELEGRTVRARFYYNSNGVGGSVHYSVSDASSYDGCYPRRTFKTRYGFDPVPELGAEVKDLRFWSEDKIFRRREKNIGRIEPLDLHAVLAGEHGASFSEVAP